MSSGNHTNAIRLGMSTRRVGVVVALGVVALVAGVAVGLFAIPARGEHDHSAEGPTTNFTYPEWVDPATGAVIEELVPDYIPIWDRTSTYIAGVVSRDYILPRPGAVSGEPFAFPGADEPWPVLDREGGDLIGHVFPGVGFVTLEEQARGVMPEPTPTTTVIGQPADQ